MNEQRVIEILETYGSREANWPREERLAVSAYLEHHSQLTGRFKDAQSLDGMFDGYLTRAPDFTASDLAARITVTKVESSIGTWFWRAIAASVFPLMLGFIIGYQVPAAEDTELLWEEEVAVLYLGESGQ